MSAARITPSTAMPVNTIMLRGNATVYEPAASAPSFAAMPPPHIAGQRNEHHIHNHGAGEADKDELGREVVLQHAADHRADGRCGAGDQADDAEHRAALFKWCLLQNDVGDKRQGDAGAERYDQSGGEQHQEVDRESA